MPAKRRGCRSGGSGARCLAWAGRLLDPSCMDLLPVCAVIGVAGQVALSHPPPDKSDTARGGYPVKTFSTQGQVLILIFVKRDHSFPSFSETTSTVAMWAPLILADINPYKRPYRPQPAGENLPGRSIPLERDQKPRSVSFNPGFSSSLFADNVAVAKLLMRGDAKVDYRGIAVHAEDKLASVCRSDRIQSGDSPSVGNIPPS